MSVGAYYSYEPQVSITFAYPMELSPLEERPEIRCKITIRKVFIYHLTIRNLVRLARREVLTSPAAMEMQSFRCCGRRPSGFVAEPRGKKEIAVHMNMGSTEA